MSSDICHGRLVTDGYGNLLADEGDRAGDPVAYHEGSYVFLNPGEPSHNERHHGQYAVVTATVDESMTDDPELVNVEEGGENEHHFTQPDPDNPVPVDPDAVSAKTSGHTDAYKGGE